MNLHSIILVLLLCFSSESRLYTAKGQATFYADRMQGRPTTSGERYDKAKLTAAHASLPFNTLVQVTNLRNGKTVVVRINDRKARSKSNIIDLSRAAAKEIDMIRYGICEVTLTELKDAPNGQQEAPAPVSTTTTTHTE